ncbi:MAG: substrate-binding domain-containing protein [Proteobacteria bacterium]|nr:substrate-binding domain-containing protein [Pseudomonadota bacterium]
MPGRLITTALVAAVMGLMPAPAAAEQYITLVGTTSTDNSGLYGKILPLFTARTGIHVRVVSVGTGRAINIARNGDADVLLVHHRASEEKFVAEGYGVKRYDVMYNDFIIVGPENDPAGIGGLKSVVDELAKIAKTKNFFVSRGDDSGTHKKELSIWKIAGIDAAKASGGWYREAGAGMGATLNTASAMPAYTLADRGTWLKFENRGGLRLLAENDPLLLNPYGVILINPARHPHIKAKMGQAFIDWITGPEGQAAIKAYRIKGSQAFFPNAKQAVSR